METGRARRAARAKRKEFMMGLAGIEVVAGQQLR